MRRRLGGLVVAALLLPVACDASSPREDGAPDAAAPIRTEPYLLGTHQDLLALPTEGRAWRAVLAAAEGDLEADLADQDLLSSGAFAAGLVYARTGDEEQRRRVEAALDQLPGTEVDGRTLALGRQLAGWVLAADLVGHRDPAFLEWLDEVRTQVIGGHDRWRSLVETHEETASNWGALAGASRLAASLYLGDDADVATAEDVLRGWLGDSTSWPTLAIDGDREERGFLPSRDFDRSWACEYPAWTPLNASCGDRDGALVEDISRGDAYPDATEDGLRYSWEALQGVVLQAILLSANGRPDVWEWGDQGLRRAAAFVEGRGGFEDDAFDPIHRWVPWAVVAVYGDGAITAEGVAGGGRSFGFADWLGPMLAPAGR